MAANRIYIQVDLNSQSAQQNVNALNTALSQTGPTVVKSSQQATGGINSIALSIQQAERSFLSLGRTLGGLAITRLSMYIVEATSDIQRMQIAFETMSGSADRAHQMMSSIEALAKREPFSFKDLGEAAQRLSGFGFQLEKIPGLLKTAADAAAAMGGGAEAMNTVLTGFGRILEKDFVGANDLFRMMASKGIPVMEALSAAAAKQLGRPVATEEMKKYITSGMLDVQATIKVIQDTVEKTRGDIGKRIVDETLSGRITKLRDEFFKLANDIGQQLVPVLQQVVNLVGDLTGSIKELVESSGWKEFWAGFGSTVNSIEKGLNATNKAVQDNANTIHGLVTGNYPDVLAKGAANLSAGLHKVTEEALAAAQATTKVKPPPLLHEKTEEVEKVIQASADLRMAAQAKELGGIARINAEYSKNLADYNKKLEGTLVTADHRAEIYANLAKARDADLFKYRLELNKTLDDAIRETRKQQEQEYHEHLAYMSEQLKQSLETDKETLEQGRRNYRDMLESERTAIGQRAELQIGGLDIARGVDPEQTLQKTIQYEHQATAIRTEAAQKQLEITKQLIDEEAQYERDQREASLKNLVDLHTITSQQMQDALQAMDDQHNQALIDAAQSTEFEIAKIRLDANKRVNEAIIEEQKKVYDQVKGFLDKLLDAITGKNIGKALGDLARTAALDLIKNTLLSGIAKQIAGQVAPTTVAAAAGAGGARGVGAVLGGIFGGGGGSTAAATAASQQMTQDRQAGVQLQRQRGSDTVAVINAAADANRDIQDAVETQQQQLPAQAQAPGGGWAPSTAVPMAAGGGTPVYDVGYRLSTTTLGAALPAAAAVTPGFAGGYPPGLGGGGGGGIGGILGNILGGGGGGGGIFGGGAGGGGGAPGGGLSSLFNLKNLGSLFGLGGSTGMSSLLSIASSKGVGMLAGMVGMPLIGQGMQRHVAPLTVAGGALTGLGVANMFPKLGLGPGAGLGVGAGIGLAMAGLQRGGVSGLGMSVAGGATAGFFLGGPLGAAIGAAAGAIAGGIRMLIQTKQEQIRSQIKQVYGVDISNRGILSQIEQTINQKYGGSISIGIRSQEIQDLIRLYALSVGQAANLPRPMYSATIAQAGSNLNLQPTYQGGQLVQNPYSGPTTYQYQSLSSAIAGLKAGTSQGVPGASDIAGSTFIQLNAQQASALMTGQVVNAVQNNPSVVASANANAIRSGDSRLSQAGGMMEPLTALS